MRLHRAPWVIWFGALLAACAPRAEPERAPRATWVGTAHQHGCVGYRDPPQAISPDGQLIAYAEGRHLRVRPIGGGPFESIPPAPSQIRSIAWHPNGDSLLLETRRASHRYWMVKRSAHTTAPFFLDAEVVEGDSAASSTGPKESFAARQDELEHVTYSASGTTFAAAVRRQDAAEIWRFRDGERATVQRVSRRIAGLAFAASGELACVTVAADHRRRVQLSCGGFDTTTTPDLDWYGPIAFSPDGNTLYAAAPSASGTLDTWAIGRDGRASQLTHFGRDTYAPSVARDGSVLLRLSSYRATVALVPADGGEIEPRTAFQSETPYWHPNGQSLSITFGTWRKQVQDVDYPDIDQRVGVVPSKGPTAATGKDFVPHGTSEDQSGSWSPDGKWFAYHSHRDGADDIFVRRANAEGAGARMTFFSRGAETFWPRWSPDGRTIVVASASRATGRHAPFAIDIDPEAGTLVGKAREIEVSGIEGDIDDLAYRPDGSEIVGHADDGPGKQVLFAFPASGGAARVIHRYATEHSYPGFALSPDGREIAFVAPASDGYQQVYRVTLSGGEPRQITNDPSNKTQPAWSPDGRTLALTVWDYQAQYWLVK